MRSTTSRVMPCPVSVTHSSTQSPSMVPRQLAHASAWACSGRTVTVHRAGPVDGVARVDAEVEQHLLELQRVDAHRRQLPADVSAIELDRRAQGRGARERRLDEAARARPCAACRAARG